MTVIGYKRSLVFLSLTVAALLWCVWELTWKCSVNRADARAAWSSLVDYERTERLLSKMGVQDTAAYLDAITHATRTRRDRYLDMIMERERARAIHDVIQDLRKKTGEDLGDAPEGWLRKYYPGSPSASTPRQRDLTANSNPPAR